MSYSYALPWQIDDGTLAQRAAAGCARRIVEGDLPPGETLTEVELAEHAGMSRTPAREAMLQLSQWGLVRLLPKKGAVVTALGARERDDLLGVRMMMETQAATALAGDPSRTADVHEHLAHFVALQRAALDAQDPVAFAAADHAFHLCLIESLDNQVVADICQDLAPRFARMTYAVIAEHPDLMPRLATEHEQLAAALGAADHTGFAAAIRAHVHGAHSPGGAHLASGSAAAAEEVQA